ncbi:MAG: hypothetical protein AB2A00_27340 [Myxococcota bacterium]
MTTALTWSADARAQATGYVQTVGLAQSKTSSSTLSVTVGTAVTAGNRVVIAFAMDDVSGTVSASDTAGNSYAVDADSQNTGTVRNVILSAHMSSGLAVGNTITVSFPTVTAKAMVVAEYYGVAPTNAVHGTASNTATSGVISTGSVTTTRADILLVGTVGTEGPEADNISPYNNFTGVAKRGTTGGTDNTNITAGMGLRVVTTTGSYTGDATISPSRSWAAALVAYQSAPSTLAFSNATRTLTAGSCGGSTNVFTLETRSSGGSAVPPTGSTVVAVSSTTATATFYSDATCTTALPVSSGAAQVTFTSSESSKSIYVLDTAVGTATISASQVSGPDTLSATSQAYTVTGGVGSNSSKTTGTSLSVTVGSVGVNQDERIVVAFAMDYTATATPALACADSKGNSYAIDANIPNTGGVRTVVFTAHAAQALVSGDVITVTHPSVAARAMTVSRFVGVASSGALDRTSVRTGSITSVTSNATATTTRAHELVIGVTGVEGVTSDGYTPTGGFTLDSQAGTTGGGANTNIAVFLTFKEVSTTGTQTSTGNLGTARDWAAAVATYKLVPNKVVISSNPSPLTAGVGEAFTLQPQSVKGVAMPPLTDTTATVTTTSGNATLYPGTACTGTSGSTVTFSASATSPYTTDVCVLDRRKSAPTHTLQVTSSSLTGTSGTYVVDAGALSRLAVALPGQTFTDGSGVSGTASNQTAGTAFTLADLAGTDDYDNVVSSFSGTYTLSYSGPSNAGDGTPPQYTTSASFTSGVATTSLVTTLVKAETVAITVTGGGVSGTSSLVTVVAPADTTSVSAVGTGYANRTSGVVQVSVVNGTGGGLVRVDLDAPSGFLWDPTSGSTTVAGWSVTSSSASTITFEGPASAFLNGATGSFSATNAGGLYPNNAVDTDHDVVVTWDGYQSGAATAAFTVLVPIGNVVLPAVSRSAASARPTFYWTNSDEYRTHSGVLILRGSDVPVDGVTYAAGDTLGSSVVVCVDGGTGQGCTESTSVTQDDATQRYVFHNFDASQVYATGVAISVPARPAQGFLYKHSAAGMTPPGVRPGSLSPPGFATFAANDLGLYFVRRDGTEERRAVLLNNQVTRRSLPLSDASAGYAVFTADSGSPNPGTLYRVEPSGSPTTSTTTAAVSSGVGALLTSSAALHSTYKANGPALLFGTNEASGNYIRAVRPDLTAYWTLSIGTDAITHEVNSDVTRAYMFVPVGAGSGGIYAFDMSVDPGAGAAPKPSGWASQKILDGTLFKAQCRMSPTAWTQQALFCGSHSGTLYAINPATGAVIATTSVTGSVQGLVAISSAGYVVYSTRSGRVGKVYFDGTAFKTAADGQANTFEVTVSGAAVVSTPLPISAGVFVGGAGKLFKLNPTDGSLLGSLALDGVQVSEVALETSTSTIFVQTSAGTIWGVPASGL